MTQQWGQGARLVFGTGKGVVCNQQRLASFHIYRGALDKSLEQRKLYRVVLSLILPIFSMTLIFRHCAVGLHQIAVFLDRLQCP